MTISPINSSTVDDVWQMNVATRQQTTVQQTVAVVAPGGADKMAGSDDTSNADQGKQVRHVLQSINHTFDTLAIGVQFEIDPDYKDVIVKVIDKESGKLIRQIPSEDVVRIAKALDKLQGLLVEQTA